MGMTQKAKEEAVVSLVEKVSRVRSGIIAGFAGLNVAEVSEIRKKLRDAKVEYRVVKNTLMKRALVGTRLEKLAHQFKGPTAIAFKYDDEAGQLGKVAKDLAKQFEKLIVRAGFVEQDILEGEKTVETMASLPTLDEARAQLLGLLNTPASKLLATLNAPASHVVGVIKAKSEKETSA